MRAAPPRAAPYPFQEVLRDAPVHRKAEVFAWFRTANAVGLIVTSASLSLTSLAVTQAVSTALIVTATVIVGIVFVAGRSSRTA